MSLLRLSVPFCFTTQFNHTSSSGTLRSRTCILMCCQIELRPYILRLNDKEGEKSTIRRIDIPLIWTWKKGIEDQAGFYRRVLSCLPEVWFRHCNYRSSIDSSLKDFTVRDFSRIFVWIHQLGYHALHHRAPSREGHVHDRPVLDLVSGNCSFALQRCENVLQYYHPSRLGWLRFCSCFKWIEGRKKLSCKSFLFSVILAYLKASTL